MQKGSMLDPRNIQARFKEVQQEEAERQAAKHQGSEDSELPISIVILGFVLVLAVVGIIVIVLMGA